MIIRESSYKDIFAIELETEKYIAKVIPSEGAKIASFKAKESGKEYLLQNRGEKYNTLGEEKSFEKSECSGFDDMFPTIDPMTVVDEKGRELFHPDHGEVCRVPFTYDIKDGKLYLFYRSDKLGYAYKKVLYEGTDGKISIDYSVTNVSDCKMDCVWTAHCLINVEKGGQILVPFDEGEPMDILSDKLKRLPVGQTIAYKKEHLLSTWTDGEWEMKKFYFPNNPKKGELCYRYVNGDTFVVEFDKEKLPVIGLWINYGALNDDFCVGIEPSTCGYDTVIGAKEKGRDCTLKQNQSLEFTISLSVK